MGRAYPKGSLEQCLFLPISNEIVQSWIYIESIYKFSSQDEANIREIATIFFKCLERLKHPLSICKGVLQFLAAETSPRLPGPSILACLKPETASELSHGDVQRHVNKLQILNRTGLGPPLLVACSRLGFSFSVCNLGCRFDGRLAIAVRTLNPKPDTLRRP